MPGLEFVGCQKEDTQPVVRKSGQARAEPRERQ